MLSESSLVLRQRLAGLMASVAAAVALAACGGSDSAPPAPAAPAPAPAPTPAGTALTGTFHGPVAAAVTLQNNGADNLAVIVPATTPAGGAYNTQTFTFSSLLASGAPYAVTLLATPPGQTCLVYQRATGTMPAAGRVNVGCEYTYDHVSRSTDNATLATYFESRDPVLGGDATYGEGRFVAFTSSARALPGGAAGYSQVYWRDRFTGETVLVSANAAGVAGDNGSWVPAISADGLTVVFESVASNLVTGDTNSVSDVFVWSALNPSAGVQRVSVGAGGAESNGSSYEPTVSGDGTVVAFSSGASNLTAGVSGHSTINVYRRVLASGATTLITADRHTGLGVGGAKPMLSQDGTRLAFYSFSAALVANDTNGLWDVFVHDATTATLQRVSLTGSGGERNQGSESSSRVVAPAISGNGRFVAFATTASNMVPGDTNGVQDVFVVDTQTGAVVRASVSTAGVQGDLDSPIGQGERLSLSYDGSWVGFSTMATNITVTPSTSGIGNAVLKNIVTGQTIALSDLTSSSVGPVAVSRNAAYAAFGAGERLDPRYASTGLFARYTGVAPAFVWVSD